MTLPLLLSACLGGGGDSTGGDPSVPLRGTPPTGNGGPLQLTGAPASTSGAFVPDKLGGGNALALYWTEAASNQSTQHLENLTAFFAPTGQLLGIQYRSNDFTPSVALLTWTCADVDCVGISVDQNAGKLIFSNTVLKGVATLSNVAAPQDITLNGTLLFSPGSGTAPDTTAPSVSTVSPAKDAMYVALSSTISARFSEPMLATSINATTFVVGGVTGAVAYSGNTATEYKQERG